VGDDKHWDTREEGQNMQSGITKGGIIREKRESTTRQCRKYQPLIEKVNSFKRL